VVGEEYIAKINQKGEKNRGKRDRLNVEGINVERLNVERLNVEIDVEQKRDNYL